MAIPMRMLLSFFGCAALLAAQREPGAAIPKPAIVPRAERAKLAALLPAPASFGGKASSAAEFYSTDLYRYLDGGAEAYLQDGFAALVHQEYKIKDADLTADVYDMGDAAHALRRYAAERPPDCRSVRVGKDGYADEGLLNFVQGEYYVKMLAFGKAGETSAPLENLARGISARIVRHE